MAPPSHMERGSSTVTINRLKKVYQKRFCGIAYASTRLGCFFKTSAIAIGVVALVLCVLLPATVSVMVEFTPLEVVDLIMVDTPSSKRVGRAGGGSADPDEARTIHVHAVMQMSKNLPSGVQILAPNLSVSYKDVYVGFLSQKEPLVLNGAGRVAFNSSLTVESTEGFHLLGNDLVHDNEIKWHISAWSTVFLPFSRLPGHEEEGLSIPNVYMSKDMAMRGCSDLKAIHLHLFDLEDVPGPGKEVRLHINVGIVNPSVVSVKDLGHVQFNVYYKGTFVTRLETNGIFRLMEGSNLLVANGLFRPENEVVMSGLIANFITGQECVLDAIAPATHASDVPLFSSFLAGLTIKAKLRGIPTGVMVSGLMDFDPLTTIRDLLEHGRVDVDTQMRLYNPFNAMITVTSVDLAILYEGTEISFSKQPAVVKIPGNSSQYTPKIVMTLDSKGDAKNLEAIIKAVEETLLHGHCLVGLRGSFSFSLGKYNFTPPYQQPENIIGCTFLDRKPCDDAHPPSGPPH